jgi:dihydroneopterin aldolase
MAQKSAEDRLTIAGIKLWPRIGVSPGERRLPQSCQADITLWGDFEAAGSTDSLDKAIDYRSVLTVAVEAAQTREYNLVETLAYRLARDVLQGFPARRVSVRVRKKPASLADKIDYVEIEVAQS